MDVIKFAFVFVLLPNSLLGQQVLPLDEAINLAIEQNFSIAVAQIDQEVSEKAVYRSNAGFGPIIDLNANATGTINDVNQNYIDGREVKRSGRSVAPNANLALNLTLYDGGRMQATFERLREISAASDVETQLQIQDVVVQVMQV